MAVGFKPITALASYGLNLEDLRTAIVDANVSVRPKGTSMRASGLQIGAND